MQCTKHNKEMFMVILYNHLEYGVNNCPVCKMKEEIEKLNYDLTIEKQKMQYYKQLIEENGLVLTECKGCGREITEQNAFISNNGFFFCTDDCAREYEKAHKNKSILTKV